MDRFAFGCCFVPHELCRVHRLDLGRLMRLLGILQPDLSQEGRLIIRFAHPQADLLVHETSLQQRTQASQVEDQLLARHGLARKQPIHADTQIRHKARERVVNLFELHRVSRFGLLGGSGIHFLALGTQPCRNLCRSPFRFYPRARCFKFRSCCPRTGIRPSPGRMCSRSPKETEDFGSHTRPPT